MNFNSYSTRKNIFFDKEPFHIISYLKLHEYSTRPKGINFSKVKEREDYIKKDNIPAVCYYTPKYDLVTKNYVRDVKFSPGKNNSKKFKLQKLWRSYEVSAEYRIVKFKK
jgi:hypothetical protein